MKPDGTHWDICPMHLYNTSEITQNWFKDYRIHKIQNFQKLDFDAIPNNESDLILKFQDKIDEYKYAATERDIRRKNKT